MARAAEAKEKEAIANASVGECTDVGGAVADADSAFNDYQKAQRHSCDSARHHQHRGRLSAILAQCGKEGEAAHDDHPRQILLQRQGP